ncbi:MAG: tripartite tricarboxylate transporter permease [Lachnospiraceae bacterium]|nr:tripartite tricarboxylate transporter permease [Lachnospiraceae bacterium]
MGAFATFASSLGQLFTNPEWLLLMAVFTALGILLGALPGISVNMSLILALPLTYSMDTETAMCVLLACYVGAMSGGLISAILLNIPGTGSSISTTFDGHPMALKGEGGRAVGIGILTSFVGGGISFLLLIFIAPLIARVALQFGNWEYFAIGIFSMTMIIGVAGDDVIKGVIAALFGMCLAMTGTAPVDSVIRYNFGFHALDGGVTTTALMCGMFAVPELLKLAKNRDREQMERMQFNDFRGFGISFREYISRWKNVLRSAVIGAYTGLLPGIGGSSASLLSYLTAKKQSKHPEEFGTGCVDGIIASETANNACIGGAMIPLLALGVPGSSSAAIVLSALTLHGIQCGPLAFTNNSDLIYLIFAILFVSNIFMLIIERCVLKGYIRILSAPRNIIMVIVIMMCFMGSYGARNNFTDVFVFAIGGAIGYFLQNAGFQRAPIIPGYILSEIIEENLVRALSTSRGDVTAVFSHPIAMVFLVIAVISFASSIRKSIKAKKAAAA